MNDVRPIDANSLWDEWVNETNENIYCPNDMLDSIDNAPTLDYIPVVYAKWEDTDVETGDTVVVKEEFYSRCSNCGYFTAEPSKYCPNCGLKMF